VFGLALKMGGWGIFTVRTVLYQHSITSQQKRSGHEAVWIRIRTSRVEGREIYYFSLVICIFLLFWPDDNFFGPVSRSFMGSERPSDSGMSEHNNNEVHDITLDSTAFSLHYRNIGGGDDRTANSAGSLLTTPSVDRRTPFVRGGINGLSGANDTGGRLKFSGSTSSAGLGDFSLAANNSSFSHYGRMSATLSDILRQVDDCLKPNPPVPHPIDVQNLQIDQEGDDAMLMGREVSYPTDASVDQTGDVAEPLDGKDAHPIDFSIDKNCDAVKPLTEEVACPVGVLVDQNGDGAEPLTRKDPHPIDVSLVKNGDAAWPVTGEVSHPIDVSIDKSGDSVKPPKEEVSYPVDVSTDQNNDGTKVNGAKPLTGKVSGPVDVSINQNAERTNPLKWEDPHTIDVSIDKNSDCPKLVTENVSMPVDVSMVQNCDGAQLEQREEPHQIDVSIDENNSCSIFVTEEVSFPVDVSIVQNGDGAKLLQREDPHQTNDSIDKNNDGGKIVKGEVFHAIDVSIEKNVNCNDLQIFDAKTCDGKPANGKDEVKGLRFLFCYSFICNS
jgi:hypothetical protein